MPVDDPRLHWLRLARLPGVGPVLIKRLLVALGSPEAVLNAHPAALSAIEGIGTFRATQIVAGAGKTAEPAREELDRIEADKLSLLTPDDALFPPGFKNIADPPVVLYVRGELMPADTVAIGIVGARQCSTYGREQAQRFGAELAQAGLTIVSGGARGIDTAAHLGALRVKGRTLVIQGCGLRHTYPPENKGLYERIVEEGAGAIISELPLDAPPSKENFPPRNRIIAALSLGILVVEANLRSGSLITARLAADDYGREVFALPGPITSPASAGAHHLIKSGTAHLADSPAEILENLGDVGAALRRELPLQNAGDEAKDERAPEEEGNGHAQNSPHASFSNRRRGAAPGLFAAVDSVASKAPARAALTSAQEKILAALTAEPKTIDDLIEGTGLAAAVLMAELTILQVNAAIARHSGNRFSRRN